MVTEDKEDTEVVHVDAEVIGDDEPMTQGEADEYRQRLLELKNLVESSYLEMGKYLSAIAKRKVEGGRAAYKVWGYSSFNDYCEQELGYRERKANHLSNIYQKTLSGPISIEAASKIEWSKMAMVVPLVDKGIIDAENAEEWMESLQGKSFAQVRTMTKDALAKSETKAKKTGKSQQAPEEVFILRVPLYKDQWENAQVALKKAQAITGSDKAPWNMDCIFMSFNSEGFSARDEALDEICTRLERVFGVKVLALNAEDQSQVMFGEDLARLLISSEPVRGEEQNT